jgi:hypothetical protein
VVFGTVKGVEALPSLQLPLRLRPLEFLFSLFVPRRSDIRDLRFLWRLSTRQIAFPHRAPRLYAMRTFLLARYLAFKFREIAAACDRVYVVCWYNASMLAMTSAFKSLGKKSWDVQHGYLGSNHDAYNNARAFSIDSSFKPDGFVVWNRRFGEYIAAHLGAPWESTDYAHLRAALPNRPADADPRPVVLYSLQWATPVPDEVAAVVRERTDLRWVFRMHPIDRSAREDLEWARALAHCEVTSPVDPLPAAIAMSRLHVTANSSVVHEAAALGVASLFLDPEVISRFEHEVDEGMARYVPAGTFAQAVRQALDSAQ